jgi:disulfide bond formation protein DsbB
MLERNLNALIVLILAGTLLSAYGVQFIWREEPCPLCLLQRIGMLGVATGALMNVIFNIRMSHYAIMLLCSIFGGFVALRQVSLHVCPGFSSFGWPVLGLSLYTWSFFVFTCVVAAVGLLLFLYNPRKEYEEQPPVNALGKFALFLTLFVAAANFFTTLWQCGLGVCEG